MVSVCERGTVHSAVPRRVRRTSYGTLASTKGKQSNLEILSSLGGGTTLDPNNGVQGSASGRTTVAAEGVVLHGRAGLVSPVVHTVQNNLPYTTRLCLLQARVITHPWINSTWSWRWTSWSAVRWKGACATIPPASQLRHPTVRQNNGAARAIGECSVPSASPDSMFPPFEFPSTRRMRKTTRTRIVLDSTTSMRPSFIL